MPPKSKKQAQEEAKKLQEQKKRRQQQQARLELERKKYLAQTLPTGLLLPASNQLVIDFANKPKDFISQKLKQAIKDAYPQISESKRQQFILKQLHYFIKDSLTIFGSVKEQMNCYKHRIFIGIMLCLLLNNDKEGNGLNKNRSDDQRKARQLATTHCNKIQGFQHLTKNEGLSILNYIKQNYFSRFELLKMFDKFPKRQTQTKFSLYVETPSIYYNEQTTPFTDLSKNVEEGRPKQQQKA